MTKGKNEPFALATLAAGYLKLLPDPQTDRYRFRAEVRHDEAVDASEAGIYFGFRTDPTATGVAHFWCSVTFADLGLHVGKSWPRGQELKGQPSRNRVALIVHRFTEPNWGHLTMATPVFDTYPPAPEKGPGRTHLIAQAIAAQGHVSPGTVSPVVPQAAVAPGVARLGAIALEKRLMPWRKLAVEVTPAAVRVFWDGQLLPDGEISVDRLEKHVNMNYQLTRRDIPGTPFNFSARGALGLVVNRGSASFRNVAVEPLR
jgi:hypothetical protein